LSTVTSKRTWAFCAETDIPQFQSRNSTAFRLEAGEIMMRLPPAAKTALRTVVTSDVFKMMLIRFMRFSFAIQIKQAQPL
jgi:hypothetical protein